MVQAYIVNHSSLSCSLSKDQEDWPYWHEVATPLVLKDKMLLPVFLALLLIHNTLKLQILPHQHSYESPSPCIFFSFFFYRVGLFRADRQMLSCMIEHNRLCLIRDDYYKIEETSLDTYCNLVVILEAQLCVKQYGCLQTSNSLGS